MLIGKQMCNIKICYQVVSQFYDMRYKTRINEEGNSLYAYIHTHKNTHIPQAFETVLKESL